MRYVRPLALGLLTTLLLAPFASADPPIGRIGSPTAPVYAGVGVLQGGSGGSSFLCTSPLAPASVEFREVSFDADGLRTYALAFVVASPCGPMVGSCEGNGTVDTRIVGSCAGGERFVVSDIVTSTPVEDAPHAAKLRFSLSLSWNVTLPGATELGVRAHGQFAGVRIDADPYNAIPGPADEARHAQRNP